MSSIFRCSSDFSSHMWYYRVLAPPPPTSPTPKPYVLVGAQLNPHTPLLSMTETWGNLYLLSTARVSHDSLLSTESSASHVAQQITFHTGLVDLQISHPNTEDRM